MGTDRKPVVRLEENWGQLKKFQKVSVQNKMPWQINYSYVHITFLKDFPAGFGKKLFLSLKKEKEIFHSDLALKHIPTDMCLEVPRKKYMSMGKKAA